MSIIRITEGTHSTEIEGSWTVFTDTFDAYAGQFSHFTAENGTVFGNPEEASKVSDNAYIPVITPIVSENDLFKSIEIIVNEKEEWIFDARIDENLRKQKAHNIKFISESQIVRVYFKAEKGNSSANDSDGGNITAFFFRFGEKNSFESKIINDVKYGDTFFIDWDKTKGIFQVQFYADDNDSFFDGDVSNVYCGAVKLYKLNCPICEEWNDITSVIPKNLFEEYKTDCHAATKKQLEVMGYKEEWQRFQLSKAMRDKNNNFIKLEYFKDDFDKAILYTKEALKNGIPVTAGIDNEESITPGNPDLTTDHFVVIVGMGTDEKGKYFTFYDNASRVTGTSDQNRLYCKCEEFKLEGYTDRSSSYGNEINASGIKPKLFTVTSIRKSIKK